MKHDALDSTRYKTKTALLAHN